MTTALVANIARPISSALSTAFNADNVGLLANYGLLGIANPDAVIEALFASGEQGAWYDPSDLSTMFQDSAGITPVTADGQPVGLIRDKSGNNHNASQATAAKRPLYKTSGGLHWLQFDGVDDCLFTSTITLSGDSAIYSSMFAGFSAPNINNQMVFEYGDASGASCAGNVFLYGGIKYSDIKVPAVLSSRTRVAYSSNTKYVDTQLNNLNGANVALQQIYRTNGVVETETGGTLLNPPFSSAPLYIGRRTDSTLAFAGNIYGMVALGRLATTQEITDTETWVAAKTGVTL